jgi:uncharacterized protein (TIGR03437 family)
MRLLAAVLLALSAAGASHPDPRRVSPQLSLASFGGHGTTSIVASATDGAGNIYVTGTTNAPDLRVRNAAQPEFGDARLLRTTDRGATWTRISLPADATSFVPDPVDPLTLYALTPKVVYKTTDGGRSWRVLLHFDSAAGVANRLAVDPGNHLRLAVVWPNSPLLRSLDGGAAWSAGGACPVDYCAGPLLADPTGSGALLVRGYQPYISLDWGATFRSFQPPGPGSLAVAAFDPDHRGWIYAGTSAGTLGGFYLSTDFGATWTAKASPPDTFSAMLTLTIDPSSGMLLATTPAGLFTSTDGAASWKRLSGPGSAPLLDTFGGPVLLGGGCGAGPTLVARVSGQGSYSVAFSSDFGKTWTPAQLSHVSGLMAAGCTAYVMRDTTTDAFVAKLAPDGAVQWATYLGGLDQDAPIALAVDTRGRAVVTGNTTSPDFPTTAPRIGVRGTADVFVTVYSPDGLIESSVLLGGEASNTVSALALDLRGNIYLGGHTNSHQFPVTPGVFITTLDEGSYSGFLMKLAPDATLVYATYLGPSYNFPGALLVDDQEQPVVGGQNNGVEYVMRLDRAASRVLSAATVPGASPFIVGPTAMAADRDGNLVIFGATSGPMTATPGAYQGQPIGGCPTPPSVYVGGNLYVTKLRASDFQTVYAAVLAAPCTAQPGGLVLDPTGAPILAFSTGSGIPLHSPIAGAPSCGYTSSAIAKLSPDGARLDFATFLDTCGVPAIAGPNDGSLIAGAKDLLRVLMPPLPGPSIDAVANAFSGESAAVVSGALYTLAVSGANLPSIDRGLTAQDLPRQLGDVEVRFDGVPAPIVQTAPGRVVVVAPQLGSGRDHTRRESETSVQLFVNGAASNSVAMPAVASSPGLLTNEFLAPVYRTATPDGYVLNQDGTINSKNNPAAAGSKITLFVTGLGSAAVYPSWDVFYPGRTFTPVTAVPLPGFIPAVSQLRIDVPDATLYTGVDAGDGVKRGFVALRFLVTDRASRPTASNYVGFYYK